jgi:DNA helicase-2/ATP-dependent DNA helicase PcrA
MMLSPDSSSASTARDHGGIVYSPAQQAIIAHRDGHLQVVACAGSGKTETMAMRIATLLAEGVAPSQILAFTFTVEAAEGLKARVLRKVRERLPELPLDRLSPMFIGTIHAWCQRFLTEQVPRYATYDLFTDHRLVGLLTREFEGVGLQHLGIDARTDAVRRFLDTASVVENEMLGADDLPAGPFRNAYVRYRQMLDRYRVLTFNQSIARTVEELRKPEVFAAFHPRLAHLLVDEFQDINPAQAKLIELLATAPVTLCAVGDDDQAIYQWRGSSVAFIRDFATRFQAHTETLDTNRRSRSTIVEAAARFAETIPDRLAKTIRATRDAHPEAVQHLLADTQKGEAAVVADALERLHGNGFAWRDAAILVRGMRASRAFLHEFDARKIPYRCEGRAGLFLQPDAEALYHVFAWLAGRDTLYDPREGDERAIDLSEILARVAEVFGLAPERVVLLQALLYVLRKALPELAEADLVGTYYRILNCFDVPAWDLDDPKTARRMGSLGRFSELLADYEAVTRRTRVERDAQGQRAIASGLSGGEHFLERFVQYVDFYARGAYDDFTGEHDPDLDAVTITTVHGAKGLEWPVVFVPALTAKRFPIGFAGEQRPWLLPREVIPAARYEGSVEDERRLFYVAMTRARDHLVLSTFRGDGHRSTKPSVFFQQTLPSGTKPRTETLWVPETPLPRGSSPEEQPTFSFSDLAQYQLCPLQYRLRQNLGFQPSAARELGYGRAVHHILRRVADSVRKRAVVPSPSEMDALFAREFYLPYANAPAWERLEARARELVDAYVYACDDELQRVWEVERPFELHLDEGNVVGRADVILDREGGVAGNLALVDYKTRKVSEDDAAMDLQLKVYTAAGRGEGFEVRAAYLHDLTAPKDNARHPVDASEEAVRAAIVTVESLCRGVRARDFAPSPGEHCKRCDVRRLCPHGRAT